MSDGVEDGESREDYLPGCESGEEAVQAAEVEDSGAFGRREEDAGDPEEEDEADLCAREGVSARSGDVVPER